MIFPIDLILVLLGGPNGTNTPKQCLTPNEETRGNVITTEFFFFSAVWFHSRGATSDGGIDGIEGI